MPLYWVSFRQSAAMLNLTYAVMLNLTYGKYCNGTACFENVNTNIYSYLETSGGQSSNLHLNAVNFSTPVLIRHPWQL